MAKFNPQDHMTKLQNQDYLEVKWRLVWFREVHPDGNIQTEPVVLSETAAIVKATVFDGDGKQLANGMATVRGANSQRMSWAGRDFEKAETAAIGRALAHAGFGTQFTADDEGDYLADSPVEKTPTSVTPDVWNKGNMTKFYTEWSGRGLERDDILNALGVKGLGEWQHSVSAANERMELALNTQKAG